MLNSRDNNTFKENPTHIQEANGINDALFESKLVTNRFLG